MKTVRSLICCFLVASLGACVSELEDDPGAEANATTPSGVVGAILSQASLGDVEIEVKWEGLKFKIEAEGSQKVWQTMQSVTFSPGGHTGWHTHAGPTFAMITSGTLTVYRTADLADCEGRVFTAGQAFMDGPDFGTHIARNETGSPTVVHLLHNLPTQTTPFRVDVPAPPGAADCGL
jgi:hypothetical protein